MIEKLTNLAEKENVDISFLSKYDPKEINEILKRDSVFILKCIAHEIDFEYIIKNYPNSLDKFESALTKNIEIKDFYKNGYSEELVNAIIGLRYQNLKQFENIVLNFAKDNSDKESLKLFVRFIQKTKPNNEIISLFKDYMKENDKETIKSLINVYHLLLENTNCENPEKLFLIGNKVKILETFYKDFDIHNDMTKFDLEKVSENFLWSCYEAYKCGFDLEKIFSKDFIKYDTLVFEALCIDAAGLEIPEKANDIINLYFETSNKEYESLLRLYKKGGNIVKLTFEDFKKLEYLVNYNKTHTPVLIENFINDSLSVIKENFGEKEK